MQISHHAAFRMLTEHRGELYALGNPRAHYRPRRQNNAQGHGDPLPAGLRTAVERPTLGR